MSKVKTKPLKKKAKVTKKAKTKKKPSNTKNQEKQTSSFLKTQPSPSKERFTSSSFPPIRGAAIAQGTRGIQGKKKKLERFKVGDYLVYPMHGVGQITSISKQSILGKTKQCYVMEIESSRMRVMVPIDNAGEIGIRAIIAKREVRKVIDLLKKDEVDTEEDWKIRYQNNMNKIKSGDIYSVAEVCRNLYKRARDRELSLMERRLYESAYRLISSEIALTKAVSVEEAGNLISEVLA